jgi:ubiquinone/menaquinone biosynthesis C-methylase UbiE
VLLADLDDGFRSEDDTFDVVHAHQVIEHVRRTDTVLREIRRVLASGGPACISSYSRGRCT